MFDIYSLTKPRVFMAEHDDLSGGVMDPSLTPAPDSVLYESAVLKDNIVVISEEAAVGDYEYPEAEGRVSVEIESSDIPKSINIINAASDFGGRSKRIENIPVSYPNNKAYRTEFRPKQGLHNLDFTTPAETPSEDEGGGGR